MGVPRVKSWCLLIHAAASLSWNRLKAVLERAWFQQLRLKYDEPLSSVAVNFFFRLYITGKSTTMITPGRAVQVHPMNPNLKPPGTKRLTLKCDI
jgi:hypothetical protein